MTTGCAIPIAQPLSLLTGAQNVIGLLAISLVNSSWPGSPLPPPRKLDPKQSAIYVLFSYIRNWKVHFTNVQHSCNTELIYQGVTLRAYFLLFGLKAILSVLYVYDGKIHVKSKRYTCSQGHNDEQK